MTETEEEKETETEEEKETETEEKETETKETEVKAWEGGVPGRSKRKSWPEAANPEEPCRLGESTTRFDQAAHTIERNCSSA